MSAYFKGNFEKIASECDYKDPLEEVICSEYVEICQAFDRTGIQDSWSWRNAHMGRELACLLIDDKGRIKPRFLERAIRLLRANLYSLGPDRHHDASRMVHTLKILIFFSQEKAFKTALNRISCPIGNLGAVQLIRETLHLPRLESVTDAHARRAVFSALLTFLRQNVGSCFATAPAIMIQSEQPLQFLSDFQDLFALGRLTRVYEGVEYTVPLSINWGGGDLYRPINLMSLGDKPLETLAHSPGLQAAFQTGYQETIDLLTRHCRWLRSYDLFTPFTAEKILQDVIPSHDLKERKNAFKALTDNALLKGWEFTLASLSESKADFAKWNFYASLGVQPDEPFGIGQSLQTCIEEKVNRLNEEIEASQSRYDHLFAQAKYIEGRMRRASTPNELEWLRADYRMQNREINRVISEQNERHDKGEALVNAFSVMMDFYAKKIREYFQEVYDAQMHDVSMNPYDDSPAGFRLLYKHGRTNAALWTMIYSAEEYLQNLNAFFVSTEIELRGLSEIEGIENELTQLVTAILLTIKQPAFLEQSINRLARAYHEPIQDASRLKRKPWAYISGGTMSTLINCYYGNIESPQEEKRWVESAQELLAFLIDTCKELPYPVQNSYANEPNASMLAFSPTHAFLFKPGWKLLKSAYESDLYTYSWIRDEWHNPQQRFLDEAILDSRMMDYLIEKLLYFIPRGYHSLVKNALKTPSYSMRSNEFCEHVVHVLSYEKWLHGSQQIGLIKEKLESTLYSCLPLFPEHLLKERLQFLFQNLKELTDHTKKQVEMLIQEMDVGRYTIFSAKDLRDIAKAILIQATKSTRLAFPFHQEITRVMQQEKWAYPEPILVADTNWVKNTFGFTVNPGNGQLELWRFDDCGSEGYPLAVWQRYLNGVEKKEWGLYVKPSEYQSSK